MSSYIDMATAYKIAAINRLGGMGASLSPQDVILNSNLLGLSVRTLVNAGHYGAMWNQAAGEVTNGLKSLAPVLNTAQASLVKAQQALDTLNAISAESTNPAVSDAIGAATAAAADVDESVQPLNDTLMGIADRISTVNSGVAAMSFGTGSSAQIALNDSLVLIRKAPVYGRDLANKVRLLVNIVTKTSSVVAKDKQVRAIAQAAQDRADALVKQQQDAIAAEQKRQQDMNDAAIRVAQAQAQAQANAEANAIRAGQIAEARQRAAEAALASPTRPQPPASSYYMEPGASYGPDASMPMVNARSQYDQPYIDASAMPQIIPQGYDPYGGPAEFATGGSQEIPAGAESFSTMSPGYAMDTSGETLSGLGLTQEEDIQARVKEIMAQAAAKQKASQPAAQSKGLLAGLSSWQKAAAGVAAGLAGVLVLNRMRKRKR